MDLLTSHGFFSGHFVGLRTILFSFLSHWMFKYLPFLNLKTDPLDARCAAASNQHKLLKLLAKNIPSDQTNEQVSTMYIRKLAAVPLSSNGLLKLQGKKQKNSLKPSQNRIKKICEKYVTCKIDQEPLLQANLGEQYPVQAQQGRTLPWRAPAAGYYYLEPGASPKGNWSPTQTDIQQ